MIVPVTLRREVTHQRSLQVGGRDAILVWLANSLTYKRWEPDLGTQACCYLAIRKLGQEDHRFKAGQHGQHRETLSQKEAWGLRSVSTSCLA